MRQKARTAGTMAPTGGFKGKGEHHGIVGEDNQWKLNPKSKFTKNLYICIIIKYYQKCIFFKLSNRLPSKMKIFDMFDAIMNFAISKNLKY